MTNNRYSPHNYPRHLSWHRFLAGTARWENRLRAGGAAGFCFVRPLTATLRKCEKIGLAICSGAL